MKLTGQLMVLSKCLIPEHGREASQQAIAVQLTLKSQKVEQISNSLIKAIVFLLNHKIIKAIVLYSNGYQTTCDVLSYRITHTQVFYCCNSRKHWRTHNNTAIHISLIFYLIFSCSQNSCIKVKCCLGQADS